MSRASDLNKTKRAESAKKLTLDKLKEAPLLKGIQSPRSQISIKMLIDEIIKYFIEIIEVLMQEENSQNYRNFLASNQKMNKQLQRKMGNIIGQKCYQIRCEFIDKFEEIERFQPSKSKVELCNDLKNERKNLAQNILSYNRSNSYRSFEHHRSHEIQKFKSDPEFAPEEEKVKEVGSIELNSIKSKLTILQENQNFKIKENLQKMERKFEEICRDVKLMAQKHVEFKLSLQQKLQLSLESIWNVISDNQVKIVQIANTIEELSNR